jgi:hypothetical protein
VRASLATSVGGEYALTRRELPGTPALRLRDDRDALLGVVASMGFGTARTPALAISPQDGVLFGASVRRRWERAPQPQTIDRSYSEASGSAQAYRSVEAFGFARHVLAVRGAAIWRGGAGAPVTGLGGITGERFLPVRGYAENAQRGTEGWSGSAEYRVPIALVARGAGLLPLFLDRVSAAAFFDAGQIRCGSEVLAVRPGSCRSAEGVPTSILAAAGGELVTDAVLMYFLQLRLRTGVGVPLTGGAPRFHVTVGPSF